MDAFEYRSVVIQVAVVDDTLQVPFRLPSQPGERFRFTGQKKTATRQSVVKRFDTKAIAS